MPTKKPSAEGRKIADRLRKIVRALPDTEEKLAWGEPTWRVGGRIFAQLDDHHHGAEHVSVHLAAPAGAQHALIDADPERFFRPPYVGGAGWIGVVLDGKPDWKMVAHLVEQAHGIIALKKKKKKRG